MNILMRYDMAGQEKRYLLPSAVTCRPLISDSHCRAVTLRREVDVAMGALNTVQHYN